MDREKHKKYLAYMRVYMKEYRKRPDVIEKERRRRMTPAFKKWRKSYYLKRKKFDWGPVPEFSSQELGA